VRKDLEVVVAYFEELRALLSFIFRIIKSGRMDGRGVYYSWESCEKHAEFLIGKLESRRSLGRPEWLKIENSGGLF
jgi:hypothetical protein